MTDDPASLGGQPPAESYRTCSACGCAVHQACPCCPECGAYPGEAYPPSADVKVNLTLCILLGLILVLALLVLSRNRDAAARAEAEKFSRISPSADSGERPPPAIPDPPAPLPTATPTLPPPTPIPFNPADMAPKPTPVPRPTAAPLPTRPPPTPTPDPVPTRSRTLDLKDQLAEEFRQELDEKMPMAKQGDYVRLTLRDNRVVSGSISRMDSNQLALQTSSGQRWILYRQLSRESRIRVDQSERDTWVEEKALEEVLKRLQN